MVGGLNLFRKRFAQFSNNFVIIGGTACDEILSGTEIRPRATMDIDIVVIVENMTPEVTTVFNKVISLDGIDLIMSTLWAKIHPADSYFTEHGVSDFRRIRNGEHLLTWDRFNDEHEQCVEFIKRSVEQSSARKRVVVTHHVPSFDLMADEFKDSRTNGAFTSDLNMLIETMPIDYWIYGHSHRNIDSEIGETKLISNQLGYVFANENDTFIPDKYIEF